MAPAVGTPPSSPMPPSSKTTSEKAVTATVDKRSNSNSANNKLGVSIKRSAISGDTRIGRVSADGLFSATDLKEGMKVIRINDTFVAGMDLPDILELLKDADEGPVTIVAEEEEDRNNNINNDIAAAAAVATTSTPPPFSSTSSGGNNNHGGGGTGGGSISTVGYSDSDPVEDSPTATASTSTRYSPPMQPMQMSMSKSVSKRSTGSFGGKEVTATVMRTDPDQKLGIKLKRNPVDGATMIGAISPEGLFASSKLKEGMVVVNINNVDARTSSLQDLAAVLSAPQGGTITILATTASSADGGAGMTTPPASPSRIGNALSRSLFGGSSANAVATPGAKLITAVVYKESSTDTLGITMNRVQPSGKTMIAKITPEGLFAATDLKAGMQVLKINNRSVAMMELEDLLRILKESTGHITVVAETSSTQPPSVVLAPTPTPTRSSSRAAAAGTAVAAGGAAAVVANQASKSTPRQVTATVHKENSLDKLGVSMRRNSTTGTTMIGKVSPDGLFADTELEEGMTVLRVNNEYVDNMELNEVLGLLKDTSGTVTIVAETPGLSRRVPNTPVTTTPTKSLFGGSDRGRNAAATAVAAGGAAAMVANQASKSTPKQVTVTVNKENAMDKLGVNIRRSSTTGATSIGKIQPDGLFANTELEEGMTVLSVNDELVDEMALNEVLGVLRDTTGTVTIVAESPGFTRRVSSRQFESPQPSKGSQFQRSSSAAKSSTSTPRKRVVAIIEKETEEQQLGISLRRLPNSNTTRVGRIDPEGLFGETGLEEGMQIVSIKAAEKECIDMELFDLLGTLKNATGEVTIVAESTSGPPVMTASSSTKMKDAAVAAAATGAVAATAATAATRSPSMKAFTPLPPPEGAGHSIILKKTYTLQNKGNSQTLSFHGQGVTPDFIKEVNRHLAAIRYVKTANPITFKLDESNHYKVDMNSDCLKYHEEDALSAIFDAMEVSGWGFRFQNNSSLNTTSRDMFVFAKLIEI